MRPDPPVSNLNQIRYPGGGGRELPRPHEENDSKLNRIKRLDEAINPFETQQAQHQEAAFRFLPLLFPGK
jgi:hypothetical protein